MTFCTKKVDVWFRSLFDSIVMSRHWIVRPEFVYCMKSYHELTVSLHPYYHIYHAWSSVRQNVWLCCKLRIHGIYQRSRHITYHRGRASSANGVVTAGALSLWLLKGSTKTTDEYLQVTDLSNGVCTIHSCYIEFTDMNTENYFQFTNPSEYVLVIGYINCL